ncbi:gamma-glutamyltransferase [Janibacter sp. DB-40]|uniref:gamma-glutamyltransferase n=1 Tax=Janibacter sp. DB-40 TaxID=3028808 RepID=UPI00240729AF|nr:gamma-glutamyltransferase [Janibacter sp. DB-40]
MGTTRPRASYLVALAAAGALGLSMTAAPASGDPRAEDKNPTASGFGGAVTSVDPSASAVGLEVLRKGGNATDAAIATTAALGVTEPFSTGIGGGGFFVHYDVDTGEVETIDGREEAPMGMTKDAFVNPDTGGLYPFSPERVTSGVAVGVPGTLATWDAALAQWGSYSMADALRPATQLARRGFVVDDTFRSQILDNEERFSAFSSTSELYLPDGEAPEVGSIFRNRDLAHTYGLISRKGADSFYNGPLAEEVVSAVQNPPVVEDTDLPVPPGSMETSDLADYEVRTPEPTHNDYRGYDVYGMAPPSSGGTTVGEILNILEQYDLGSMPQDQALHHYLEASALAYADRGAYLGDSEFVDVPVEELLSDGFAGERSCQIDPERAADKPVDAGEADGDYVESCDQVPETVGASGEDSEGLSTTHLTVADQWGNVVSYTTTIEQTGGSGIVVPDRGFLLNNELTDFSADPDDTGPNSIAPGKRPRSSISPTIVLEDGEPAMALGSPGGSTIITTVAQTLVNRIDLGMDMESALAAPRASQRNTTTVSAEPEFTAAHGAALRAYGHEFSAVSEIGALTAIEFLPDGSTTAVAEPVRRGGGDARVVDPR